MLITNIIQDSFQEYEGHHALVLFSHGCNLRCKRCYNLNEVLDKNKIIGEAKKIIDQYLTPIHEAVVFLGGEPTIWEHELIETIRYVKSKGLKTKLYTNGLNPLLISKINDIGLIDSYSVDLKVIKSIDILNVNIILEDYLQQVDKTIKNILSKNIDLEIRTTMWEGVDLPNLEKYVKDNYPNIRHILTKDFLYLL